MKWHINGVVPNHHFAAASSECIDLYRDGYALGAVMVSQAVAEGIWRFVLERNQFGADQDHPGLAATLVERGILSTECTEAFGRIWRSFRNDVHHMNPSVSGVPFRGLARRNLLDLATIEREIFAVSFDNGKLVPSPAALLGSSARGHDLSLSEESLDRWLKARRERLGLDKMVRAVWSILSSSHHGSRF